MSNTNTNQCSTQIKDLNVMIARCSFNSQHEGLNRLPANVGWAYFKYSNRNQGNNPPERHQRKNRLDKTTKVLSTVILKTFRHKEEKDVRNFDRFC